MLDMQLSTHDMYCQKTHSSFIKILDDYTHEFSELNKQNETQSDKTKKKKKIETDFSFPSNAMEHCVVVAKTNQILLCTIVPFN